MWAKTKAATLLIMVVTLCSLSAVAVLRKPDQLATTVNAVNPPETEIDLLGVTPEGVKVYRLRQAKFIVPAYVAVAPNGSIAIR